MWKEKKETQVNLKLEVRGMVIITRNSYYEVTEIGNIGVSLGRLINGTN